MTLALDTGSGATYYRFGVTENGGVLYLAAATPGPVYITAGTLMTDLQANVWYGLELTLDGAGGFLASVWDESTPSVRHEARYEMPAAKSWSFRQWLYSGASYLDTYREERPGGTGQNLVLLGKHYEKDLTSGTITKRYYAGGRLLATRSGSTLRYIQPDHLGSATTLTDASGQVVARERYSAFGERRRGETPLTTDQLYTGQRYNALSALYHYSDGKSPGRFYDPLLSRFIQADSVTPGKHSQALNRYALNFNNPIKYVDPNGQFPVLIAAGAAVGGAVAYGLQVRDNIHSDPDMGWQAALTTNIDGGKILTGAAIGASAVIAAPFVAAEVGTGLVAVGGALNSGTLISAGSATYTAAGTMAAAVAGTAAVSAETQASQGYAHTSFGPSSRYTRTDFQGRRVYMRGDIDWGQTDAKGRTNLELAKAGRVPFGPDGERVNLHHLLQEEPGPMAEVLGSVHRRGQGLLHTWRGRGESFRNDAALEQQYDKFRREWWQWRASRVE